MAEDITRIKSVRWDGNTCPDGDTCPAQFQTSWATGMTRGRLVTDAGALRKLGMSECDIRKHLRVRDLLLELGLSAEEFVVETPQALWD